MMGDDRVLLAVLGRGIQKTGEKWEPTGDFEVFRKDQDGRMVHSATPISDNDDDENCLIGGGKLNVEAAALLLRRTKMRCVLGYAPPAPYLRSLGGPSESLPMGKLLRSLVPGADINDWKDGLESEKSNTIVEVNNVMKLAGQIGIKEVRFLTISPHVPRVTLIAQKAPKEQAVKFTVESSETIISTLEPASRTRIARIQQSKAYRRTVAAENVGISTLLTEW